MSPDTDPARRISLPGLSDALGPDLPAPIAVVLAALMFSIVLVLICALLRQRRRAPAQVTPGPARVSGGVSISAGIAAYHRGHAHVMRPHLDALRDRQNPDVLFVTCSDSRLVPHMFTSSGPGDLFTVRNIGNLIPRDGDTSVEAAIVYAVDVLGVRSVVVCGHSGCGAMDALYHERAIGSGLDEWLAHGRAALERFRRGHPVAAAAAAAGFGEIDQLGMVNVAVQMETLARHDRIARAVAERGLSISGLFFDIGTARVMRIAAEGIVEFADAAGDLDIDNWASVAVR